MIRNILYLDEQKMYSLSSQIFEGITESVVNENLTGKEESETQKGPALSGKEMADVINTISRSTEKKFLHDHSYALFEKELINKEKILEIKNQTIDEMKFLLKEYSFLKISSQASFHDYRLLDYLFNNFNKIGEAIACVAHQELLLLPQKTSGKKRTPSSNSRLTQVAKEEGLYQDPKFSESMSLITQFGFSDQLEVNQSVQNVLYTSYLKRDCLREKEELLVKKYSRNTERKLVVLGIVTQAFDKKTINLENNTDSSNMQSCMTNMMRQLSNVEDTMSGKFDNEIRLDPIAIYVEL